jgi:hypothetical protein
MAAKPARAQAPCEQVRTACKNAGFVQGGPIGSRLVLDCFNPLCFWGEAAERAFPAAAANSDGIGGGLQAETGGQATDRRGCPLGSGLRGTGPQGRGPYCL